MVLPEWIEHSTSPLPRGCSTTELRQQKTRNNLRTARTRRKLPQGPPLTQGNAQACVISRRAHNLKSWTGPTKATKQGKTAAATSAWRAHCGKISAAARPRNARAGNRRPRELLESPGKRAATTRCVDGVRLS